MINPWDNNAHKRHQQILDGRDFSFDKVLLPTFIKLLKGIKNVKSCNVLDVGCGSGILAYKLSKQVGRIAGIDPSRKSIEIANYEYRKLQKIEFHCSTVDKFRGKRKFDVAISNMTVQAIKNIGQVFSSVSRLLKDSGLFIFSIPHPCFWISYRKTIGLDEYKNYSYNKNSAHAITFSISNDRNPLPSPVPLYHRRIEYYSTQLSMAGFSTRQMLEPIPIRVKNVKANWEFPHFLFFVCEKSNYQGGLHD